MKYEEKRFIRPEQRTLLFDNGPHTMEEPSVLGVRLGLVMYELYFNSLHGTDN